MIAIKTRLSIVLLFTIIFTIISASDLFPQKKEILIPKTSQQIIYGRITDKNGKPLIAQVQAWRYPLTNIVMQFGDKKIEGRTDNLIQMKYSSADGYYSIKVPADTILLIITKGPEWNLVKEKFVIKEKEFNGIEYNASLKKLYDLSKLGWFAGDTHHHSIYSDGHQDPSEIAQAMKSVGLSWGMLTDHNSDTGTKEWLANKTKEFIPISGCEISTEASVTSIENGYGHLNQTFIDKMNAQNISNPNIWARAIFDDSKDVQNMIDLTHQQNGLIAVNHPFQAWDWAGRYKSWGKIKNLDAIEVWNGEPPHSYTYNDWDTAHTNINTMAVHAWFSYLNEGNKISGIAGSDCHDVTGVTSYPKGEHYWTITTGNPRTYAYCGKLSEANIKSAIKNGNLFLTSNFGPLLLFKVNGKYPGEVIKISSDGKIKLNIDVLANQNLLKSEEGLRIIFNGKIIKKFTTDSLYTFRDSTTIILDKDGWIVAEAFGQWPMYSITNPIFIDIPPYGDFIKTKWVDPIEATKWNQFRQKSKIDLLNGPTSWKDTKDSAINIKTKQQHH
ncbi:MAG: CehA/McbA family metallohydrolase [Ignavibacteriales bacterium]|nr:CehA/McbA family metallohydrolase [Ignavibacteriales bacterium]